MELDLQDIASRTGKTVAEIEREIALAKESMIPKGKQVYVTEASVTRWFIVTRKGVGVLLTNDGYFHHFDFAVEDQWEKYSVIFRGTLDDQLMPVFTKPEMLLIRVDSGCETGQLFCDITCECREQLGLAMKTIADAGEGMIVNIPRQDGRGFGLPFKLATLRLQTLLKMNTVEAAHAIAPNGVIDIRTYAGVIGILKYFNVPTSMKINLATNNPHKAKVFDENGYSVEGYTPVLIPATAHTSHHLYAKQEYMGHIGLVPLSPEAKEQKVEDKPTVVQSSNEAQKGDEQDDKGTNPSQTSDDSQ